MRFNCSSCNTELPKKGKPYTFTECPNCGKEHVYNPEYGWLGRVRLDSSFDVEYQKAANWQKKRYEEIIQNAGLDPAELQDMAKEILLWLAGMDSDKAASYSPLIKKEKNK